MTAFHAAAEPPTTFSADDIARGLPPSSPRALIVGENRVWDVTVAEAGLVVAGSFELGEQVNVQPPRGPRQAIRRIPLSAHLNAGTQFGLVAIDGIGPEIHPLALFDEIDRVIQDDGVVLLRGMKMEDGSERVINWVRYWTAIAQRCGYRLLEEPRDGMEHGQGSFQLAFQRAEPPRWRIHHVLPGDFAEVATLFSDVFGQPLSQALWSWKYGDGRGNAVSVRRDGVLVAHYGGLYRDILLFGKPEWAFQICDVMVHGKERGVLTRQGPFFLAAATSAEIYGPLGYGFPNARAMRVAEKMGLYAPAGKLVEVRWPPAQTRSRVATKVRHLQPDRPADRHAVDRLWAKMASDLSDSAVGVRNWEYLQQRYVRHPHHHYEILVISQRLTGRALGIAVLRNHEGRCELLDIIAPLRQIALVLDQARRMTGIWGLDHLYCWITENHAHRFLACEGHEHPLDVSIPTSCWTADPRAEAFSGKWWLTSGDTDFH